MNKTAKTVWSDQYLNFYMIPDDFMLSEGEYKISTMSGNEKCVDKTSVEAFKVSRKEAKDFLEQQLKQSVDQTKKAFLKLRNFSSETGDRETTEEEFSQASGIENLVQSLTELMPGAKIEEALEKGKSLEEGLGAIKGKVKAYLESEEAEASFKSIAEKLRAIAGRLEKGGKADDLTSFISDLGKDLFSEEQEDKKEQEERIARSVQDSISSALKDSGFEPFKGVNFDEQK